MAVSQKQNTETYVDGIYIKPKVKKPRGKGKPFTKGDPRINRKGRLPKPAPKTLKQLKNLIIEILSEPAPKKKQRNKLENALDLLLRSTNGSEYVIDKVYGKTPTTIDMNMLAIFQQINLESLPIELLDRIAKNDVSVLGELIGNKDVVEGDVKELGSGQNEDENNSSET